MMSGLDHLHMKIGRAEKHLREFDGLVVDHARRPDPYSITEKDDTDSGRYIIRVEYSLIDGDVPLSLGDFVYNLRSGLDQLAWGLALIGTPDPGRDTMFPIHQDTARQSEDVFKKKVWDMPCEAIAVIKSLQPYQRGNAFRDHPLWHLNELSNIDKHRTPGGRAHDGGFYMEPPPNVWLRSDFDNGVEFSLPLALKNTVKFEPKVPLLTFGDPIDSTSGRVPIELTREQVAEIYRYVREDVTPLFTRFFP